MEDSKFPTKKCSLCGKARSMDYYLCKKSKKKTFYGRVCRVCRGTSVTIIEYDEDSLDKEDEQGFSREENQLHLDFSAKESMRLDQKASHQKKQAAKKAHYDKGDKEKKQVDKKLREKNDEGVREKLADKKQGVFAKKAVTSSMFGLAFDKLRQSFKHVPAEKTSKKNTATNNATDTKTPSKESHARVRQSGESKTFSTQRSDKNTQDRQNRILHEKQNVNMSEQKQAGHHSHLNKTDAIDKGHRPGLQHEGGTARTTSGNIAAMSNTSISLNTANAIWQHTQAVKTPRTPKSAPKTPSTFPSPKK
jgi:hypothetical protein